MVRMMVEFNNGFITALTLFYGHLASFRTSPDLVLYAATDHLYEIEYPDNISAELKDEIMRFVDYAFSYRMRYDVTREEVFEVFDQCKNILIKIDNEVFGLTVEANYS